MCVILYLNVYVLSVSALSVIVQRSLIRYLLLCKITLITHGVMWSSTMIMPLSFMSCTRVAQLWSSSFPLIHFLL